jgi:hypothetical protein
MSKTWLSIRVELVGGRGQRLWPRPGRTFAASRTHSFEALAYAIDDAFARWDRSHLYGFHLDSERWIGPLDRWDGATGVLDGRKMKLNVLKLGERFAYTFDFGDDWTHLCSVSDARIDPLETVGVIANRPLPYLGWGDLPDQYGRRYETDDGETPVPPDPKGSDLPELLSQWAWP